MMCVLQDNILVAYDCCSNILVVCTGKTHGCPPSSSVSVGLGHMVVGEAGPAFPSRKLPSFLHCSVS